ncbi:GDSL-type esterase/lipase family protein [Myxococcaceae bacterium GXIMD 01537]
MSLVLMGQLLAACGGAPERAPVPVAQPAPAPAPAPPPPPPPPEPPAWLAPADVLARAWEPAPRRVLPAPSERAQELQSLATQLDAVGSPIEDPCVAPAGPGCARTALEPFFAALDALAAGTASGPTVVEAFGNSLIAGDRIVDIIREDLVAGFGGAGRGVLLVDRMAPYGGRSRTGIARDGWEPRTLGELRRPPHPFGITGVYHVSTRAKASSRFELDGERRATLWWLDVPKGGRLTVTSGGKLIARTEPTGDGAAHALAIELAESAKSFEVTAERAGAVVLSVTLQHERPGIVLDMLGVPSADAGLFLRTGEDILKAQLAERAPRLMLFFLGGNEAKRLEWKRSTPEQLRTDLAALLSRARAAAPDSACLVMGPIDAVQDRNEKGKRLSQRPYLEAVIAAEREVAHAQGCAFFNHFAAMGGEGSLTRFYKAGLVHDDLVHPKGQGLDLLGQLAVDALLRAWVETPAASDRAALASAWDALRTQGRATKKAATSTALTNPTAPTPSTGPVAAATPAAAPDTVTPTPSAAPGVVTPPGATTASAAAAAPAATGTVTTPGAATASAAPEAPAAPTAATASAAPSAPAAPTAPTDSAAEAASAAAATPTTPTASATPAVPDSPTGPADSAAPTTETDSAAAASPAVQLSAHRFTVVAADSHPAREGLARGLSATSALAKPEQVEVLLAAPVGPTDEALTQALAQARTEHPQAECLWLALGAGAPAPEGCRALNVKLDDPDWRPFLAERGWRDGKEGGWTRRGGLGLAALVLSTLERERSPRAPSLMATEEVR